MQADALQLGRNWDLGFKVALNVREQNVTLGKDAPRKGFFQVCFHAPTETEKARLASATHARFHLEMGSGWEGRLDGELLGPGQSNGSTGKAGPFEGMKNTGFEKSHMLHGGKTLPPASADGRYSVQLSLREDAFKAVINGQTILDERLPPAAVTLIENSPLAL